jgi:hypothetical protein
MRLGDDNGLPEVAGRSLTSLITMYEFFVNNKLLTTVPRALAVIAAVLNGISKPWWRGVAYSRLSALVAGFVRRCDSRGPRNDQLRRAVPLRADSHQPRVRALFLLGAHRAERRRHICPHARLTY